MTEFTATIDEMEGMNDFRLKLFQSGDSQNIIIDGWNGETKKVVIPTAFGAIPVTEIGKYAFLYKSKIQKITLPACIKSIGDHAFSDCSNLNDIIFPENLANIDDYAFDNCEQLSAITLPKGLVNMGDNVFTGCGNLAEINVDEQNPVFCSMDGVLFNKSRTALLKYPQAKKGEYTIPVSVIELADDTFTGCNELSKVIFPQNLMDADWSFFGCNKLEEITVSNGNTEFSSIDGVLFDNKGEDLLRYPMGKSIIEYLIPEKTEYILHGAFYECKKLANVIFPEGLKHIQSGAFRNCENLTALTLPSSLAFIGQKAFKGCTRLRSISLSHNTMCAYTAFEGFEGELIYRE